ncbi:Essential protein Yae1, N terminal [Schaereria dolodes]|nr:Essential protein Yae1, N terminal [Schaereria dolodes]
MLRDLPAVLPDQPLDVSQEVVESPQHTSNDLLSDIFSDSPLHSPSYTNTTTLQPNEPSEVPRLRTTHTTAGYRDGITTSKVQSLQPGFDEGYSLGATIGLRVGYILGVLEGIYGALKDGQGEKTCCKSLLDRARLELDLRRIFGEEVWAEDGTWRYAVEGREEEITFEKVTDAHPILMEWKEKLDRLVLEWEIVVEKFEEEEQEVERGRLKGGL